MPWVTPVEGYIHRLGYAYCVRHSYAQAKRVREIHADTFPEDTCDRCGCRLGGKRGARRTVRVE